MARSELLRLRPWLVVLGGLLVHLTIGSYYSFGNMNPYITSYIRLRGNQPDLTFGQTVWIYTLLVVGVAMAMFVGGFLGEKIGTRWTTLIGSVLSSGGITLSYFTCHDLYLLMLTYGLMFGVGTGIAYVNPLTCAMRWFPNYRGMAAGTVVAGFGAASTIFTQVQTVYINPDDVAPDIPSTIEDCIQSEKYFGDSGVLDRVPKVFLLQGGIFAAMQLLGCILITDPPKESVEIDGDNLSEASLLLDQRPSADEGEYEDHYQLDCTLLWWRLKVGKIDGQYSKESFFGRSLSVQEALRTYLFPLLWIFFLFNGQATIYLLNMYKTFGQTFISSDHFLSIVGTISSPFNAITRVFWGVMVDRFSYKPAMLTLGGMCTALLVTYYFTSEMGRYAYAIWTPALFFCIGGNYALWPFVVTSTFGPKHASFLYGLLFTSQIVGGVVTALAHSQLTCAIGYGGLIAMASAFQVISMLLTLLYPEIPQKIPKTTPSSGMHLGRKKSEDLQAVAISSVSIEQPRSDQESTRL